MFQGHCFLDTLCLSDRVFRNPCFQDKMFSRDTASFGQFLYDNYVLGTLFLGTLVCRHLESLSHTALRISVHRHTVSLGHCFLSILFPWVIFFSGLKPILCHMIFVRAITNSLYILFISCSSYTRKTGPRARNSFSSWSLSMSPPSPLLPKPSNAFFLNPKSSCWSLL